MYIKHLIIKKANGETIRNIPFHAGLNLIVDETPIKDGKETGNNVGKTTILKLIDYCLGGKARYIYTDNENQKHEYTLVKNYLIENNIVIQLVLVDDINNKNSKVVTIERNFRPRREKIQYINGESKQDEEFDRDITELLFPNHFGNKPTFRQIISHNIRYSDQSIENTLRTLDKYSTDIEYETLYLFLFGCEFIDGDMKQNLRTQILLEEKFKNRLEADQTRSAYEAILSVLSNEINKLEKQKSFITINPNFESDLNKLNDIKYKINIISSKISNLELRKKLIIESENEMREKVSNINLKQLKQIYDQATSIVDNIQKTFEELVVFHNKMISAKIDFISKDLPVIERAVSDNKVLLSNLLNEEEKLNALLLQSTSFGNLEDIISKLNGSYQKKGEYESIINQIKYTESQLSELNDKLSSIDDILFSKNYKETIQKQINKFNMYFSSISDELYGEKYAIKFDEYEYKGKRLYKFSAFNINFSSGKKQGEISCFDLAYTVFADNETIPCMHFLLNDKRELMHGNQLIKIGNYANMHNIQFVASILKDKLPSELVKDEYIIIRLSQEDKLFKIEGNMNKNDL
jgi:uncharacterized protein YydD (DUF2326 family)